MIKLLHYVASNTLLFIISRFFSILVQLSPSPATANEYILFMCENILSSTLRAAWTTLALSAKYNRSILKNRGEKKRECFFSESISSSYHIEILFPSSYELKKLFIFFNISVCIHTKRRRRVRR